MKSLRLFLLLLIASKGISVGATIQVSGRITGYGVEPNPASTLDYYFLTIFDNASIDASISQTAGPLPGGGLNLKIFLPPDDTGYLVQMASILGATSFSVSPGVYIAAVYPRNSDFDGDNGGIIPTAGSSSRFAYTDYTITFNGNLRLDEKWIGQSDGAFRKTVVPEPSGNLLVSCAAAALAVTRNRLRPTSSGIPPRMLPAVS